MTATPFCQHVSNRNTKSHHPVTCQPIVGSILLAEHNDAHALLTRVILEGLSLPLHVDRARDREEALAYLQRGPYDVAPRRAFPALILLDLHLPKLGGLELLQQIKASRELREIPVVVLSTLEAETDVAAAYDLHANGYLIKPFDNFAIMIEAVATYWLKCNARMA